MTKKILCIFISLLMVFSIIAIPAFAATSGVAKVNTDLSGKSFSLSSAQLKTLYKNTTCKSVSNMTFYVDLSTKGDVAAIEFSPTTSGLYELYTNSSFDTVGSLGHIKWSLFSYKYSEIKSDDDSGNSFNFKITAELTAGETYHLLVRLYGLSNKTSSLAVYIREKPADVKYAQGGMWTNTSVNLSINGYESKTETTNIIYMSKDQAELYYLTLSDNYVRTEILDAYDYSGLQGVCKTIGDILGIYIEGLDFVTTFMGVETSEVVEVSRAFLEEMIDNLDSSQSDRLAIMNGIKNAAGITTEPQWLKTADGTYHWCTVCKANTGVKIELVTQRYYQRGTYSNTGYGENKYAYYSSWNSGIMYGLAGETGTWSNDFTNVDLAPTYVFNR